MFIERARETVGFGADDMATRSVAVDVILFR